MDPVVVAKEIEALQTLKKSIEDEHTLLTDRLNESGFLDLVESHRKAEIEAAAQDIMMREKSICQKILETPGLDGRVQAILSAPKQQLLTAGPAGRTIRPDELDSTTILCCACGVPTQANEARVCFNCLNIDITEGIPRQSVIQSCRSCRRYSGDSKQWLTLEWESPGLLAMCLKKIPLKKTTRLVDAKFIWTESHSRRIKVQLTVEKEVLKGAVLQQTLVVEYYLGNLQCQECTKSVTPHLWSHMVQVRQRADHKRTILYLEQLVLAHHAHANCINIIDRPDGMDFCFVKASHANHFLEWVQLHFPVDVKKTASQLVSHDPKSNTCNNKHVRMAELSPISRDDLVYLSKKEAQVLGGVSSFMICRKISTGVHLIDPFTLRGVDIDNKKYWSSPLKPCLSRKNLTEFMILDVKHLQLSDVSTAATPGRFLVGMIPNCDVSTIKKAWGALHSFQLAEIEIARTKDLGRNDNRLHTITHLGRVLKAGDTVLGYDLETVNSPAFENDEGFRIAAAKLAFSVIIVRRSNKNAKRSWVLKQLPNKQIDPAATKPVTMEEDIEAFKDEIEQNQDLIEVVHRYRKPGTQSDDETRGETRDIVNLMTGLTLEDKIY